MKNGTCGELSRSIQIFFETADGFATVVKVGVNSSVSSIVEFMIGDPGEIVAQPCYTIRLRASIVRLVTAPFQRAGSAAFHGRRGLAVPPAESGTSAAIRSPTIPFPRRGNHLAGSSNS